MTIRAPPLHQSRGTFGGGGLVTAIASLQLQLTQPLVPTPCNGEPVGSSFVASNGYASNIGAVPIFLRTHEPNTVCLRILGRKIF